MRKRISRVRFPTMTTIPMPDGSTMEGFVALPEAGRGPGVLVLMEIFGVGSYIRRACERLAELGYVAMAPDLYRRIEPGLEIEHDEAGIARALETVQRLDMQGAVEDAAGALHALRPRAGGTDRPGAPVRLFPGGPPPFA